MTELEAAMVLQRIRARVASRHGLTVAEMRRKITAHERAERRGGVCGLPMGPTEHKLRGGLDCEGC